MNALAKLAEDRYENEREADRLRASRGPRDTDMTCENCHAVGHESEYAWIQLHGWLCLDCTEAVAS